MNLPLPFPDALQEFSVETSALSARYGMHAGAVVNAVTKVRDPISFMEIYSNSFATATQMRAIILQLRKTN